MSNATSNRREPRRGDARALWIWTLFEQLLQDVRFAIRTMGRSRSVTMIATLTLALGIGANTAIYSFMDAILLRALPVPDPASLVVLTWQSPRPAEFGARNRGGESAFVMHAIDGQMYDEAGGSAARIFPYPAYELLRDAAAPVMGSLFAYYPAGRVNIVANNEADVVQGEYVSGDYFAGLNVLPAAGRAIQMADDHGDAPPVAVLSMRYARARFGDAQAAVGQAVRIDNQAVTIVGVTPAEFFGVDPAAAPDVYLPLHSGPISTDPNGYWLEMMGRLRPGIDAVRAQAMLAATFQPWVAGTATTARERANLPELRLAPGAGGLDTLRRQYSQPLYVLMAMVALILAIACANTANLLLARAAARRREMAVRLSVGAGRGRLLRQLLTESVCLACISGALGVAVALASMRLLTVLLANGQETFTLHAELNWRVWMWTLAVSLTCGIVFGLAPALQSARPSVLSALKDAGGGGMAGSARRWARGLTLTRLLLVSQIALSVLLLVGAGLFGRTLSNLQSLDLGFNPNRVLLFDVNARQAGHGPDDIARFYEDLRQRLTAVPGVSQVTLSHASLIRAGRSIPIAVAGSPAEGARILDVGPEFFATMQIPLVEGRAIEVRDAPGRPAVAVVSDVFARTFFEGQSAVGRRLTVDVPVTDVTGQRQATGPIDVEIVGVAGMARYGDLRDRMPPVVYLPYGQIPFPPIAQMTFALRTTLEELAVVPDVRRIVHDADPRLPLTNVRSQTVEIDRTINLEILFARLCGAFASLALVIACVGIYGTMAYAVARRTNEIGVRLALGARNVMVARTVLRDVCVLAACGVAVGLPPAFMASRLIQAILFGVAPNDPGIYAGAALMLTIAAAAAGAGPAYRASRISPMTALRTE